MAAWVLSCVTDAKLTQRGGGQRGSWDFLECAACCVVGGSEVRGTGGRGPQATVRAAGVGGAL